MAQSVSDCMTQDPRTVSAGDSLVDAARVMKEENVGNVIVEDDGQVAGILTDRDIVVRAVADGSDPSQAKVGDVATKDPATLSPDQDVEEAAKLMREHDVRRVPVVQDGRAVGIITLGDLAVDQHSQSDDVLADVSGAAPNN